MGGGGLRRQIWGFNAGHSGDWFCVALPDERLRLPLDEEGSANGEGDSNKAYILYGQPFNVARCKCWGVHGSMRKNPPLETPSLICFLPTPNPRNEQSKGAQAQVGCQSCTCGRTSPPSSPITQAHIVRSLGGGGTNPLVAMMSILASGDG